MKYFYKILSVFSLAILISCSGSDMSSSSNDEGPIYKGPYYNEFLVCNAGPNFTEENQKFEIGKAVVLEKGTDVSIFATGHLVWPSIEASRILKDEGISVELINILSKIPSSNFS